MPVKEKPPRPLRGSPSDTRARLVEAAADVFNRSGFNGTDSNRIAAEAGYSTGVFYKHFKDKREIFLAVYEGWVSSEWKAVAAAVDQGGTPEEMARRLVMLAIEFHTRWIGFRASLHQLILTDAQVRRFYCKQRKRQLDVMAELRAGLGIPPQKREDDAILLFTTERTYDAVARGELRDLGVNREAIIDAMIQKVQASLEGS